MTMAAVIFKFSTDFVAGLGAPAELTVPLTDTDLPGSLLDVLQEHIGVLMAVFVPSAKPSAFGAGIVEGRQVTTNSRR